MKKQIYPYDGSGRKLNLDIAGQSVPDGVFLRTSTAYSTAYLKEDGKIEAQYGSYTPPTTEKESLKDRILKLPFIRALRSLFPTLKTAVNHMTDSAERTMETFDFVDVLLIVVSVVGVASLLFLPTIVFNFIEAPFYIIGLLEGLMRFLLFVLCQPISFKIVDRVYDGKGLRSFHGAEHKVIHCYEAGGELSRDEVKKYSRRHIRCSSNELAIGLVIGLFFCVALPTVSVWWRLLATFLSLPFIAAITLEINWWRVKSLSFVAKAISYPGYLLQHITTEEPNDKMIDVAVFAMKMMLKAERDNEEDVVIIDGVTEISTRAFADCKKMNKVHLPDSVLSIDNSSFCGCSSLAGIRLPNSIIQIGYMAFAGCTSLSNINIPNSVTTIGRYAFSECTSLVEINIPDSVSSVSDTILAGCVKLENISIPTHIDSTTFNGVLAVACNKRGLSFWNENQYENARQEFDKAVQLNPDCSSYIHNRGHASYYLGDLEDALEDFNAAICMDADGKYPEWRTQCATICGAIGLSFWNENQYENARQEFDKAVQLNSEDASYIHNRGHASYYLGEFAKALEDFDAAISMDTAEQYPEWRTQRAEIFEALEAGGSATTCNARGLSFWNESQYENARQEFDKAVQLNPDCSSYIHNRGHASYYLGDLEDALEDFNAAISMDVGEQYPKWREERAEIEEKINEQKQ